MGNNASFRISLTDKEWNASLGGWTSEALSIPGLKIITVYANGSVCSPDQYEHSAGKKDIRWRDKSPRPSEIIADLELTIDLNDLEKKKIELEEERVKILRSELIWKIVSGILGIILTGVAVYSAIYKPQQKSSSTAASDASSTSLPSPKNLPPATLLPSPTPISISSAQIANRQSSPEPTPISKFSSTFPPSPINPSPSISPQAPTSNSNSSDWLICWHGKPVGPNKVGYEYLIAYPPATFQGGLNLTMELSIRPGEKPDTLANDSLKMCYLRGQWYGGNESSRPWFPHASYLKVQQGSILLYDDVSGQGKPWEIVPSLEKPSPSITSLTKELSGSEVQVLKSRETDSSGN
jgi:hypothetical protein